MTFFELSQRIPMKYTYSGVWTVDEVCSETASWHLKAVTLLLSGCEAAMSAKIFIDFVPNQLIYSFRFAIRNYIEQMLNTFSIANTSCSMCLKKKLLLDM